MKKALKIRNVLYRFPIEDLEGLVDFLWENLSFWVEALRLQLKGSEFQQQQRWAEVELWNSWLKSFLFFPKKSFACCEMKVESCSYFTNIWRAVFFHQFQFDSKIRTQTGHMPTLALIWKVHKRYGSPCNCYVSRPDLT